MAIRYYLAPMAINARGYRAPAFTDTLPRGTQWDALDYGNESACILAIDTDAATHTAFAANSGVSIFPANIDSNVGANLATVQATLESYNIPGDAVTAGTTYRTVIKGITAIMSVMQRYAGITGGNLVFNANTNLDKTLGSIPASVRGALQQACDDLGYDTNGLTGQSTIRDFLKKLALQPHDIVLLGVAI